MKMAAHTGIQPIYTASAIPRNFLGNGIIIVLSMLRPTLIPIYIYARFRRTGKRNEIFLATKFAFEITASGIRIRGDAEYVKLAMKKSLERLGVDNVDLYYAHRYDRVAFFLPYDD
jgi:Aldo/keto reductase family